MSGKAVIFDMDGVLIDSMNIWYEEGVKLLSNYPIVDSNQVCSIVTPISVKVVVDHVLKHYHLDVSQKELNEKWRSNMEQRYFTDIKLKPNIEELLKLYKEKGYKLAVASATKSVTINNVLTRLNINHYLNL